MRAVVNDAIHVQIQAVELWDTILCDELRYGGIPLAHPAKELGNTHGGGG